METFRIANDQLSKLERARLRIYLKNLLARHEILKDLLDSLDENRPVNFVQLISLDDTVNCAASKVMDRFGLDQIPSYCQEKVQGRTLYQEIKGRCENNCIFVLMAGYFETGNYKLGNHVFSGISIADKVAPIVVISVWQRTRRFSLYGRILVGRNGLAGTRRGAFRAGTERIRLGRPDFRRLRRLSGGPAQAPPPAALRPAGISGNAPLRRRVCAVPAAAARGRAGSARAGGCWRRGRRGRQPARTGPARAAAPGRGRGAPAR